MLFAIFISCKTQDYEFTFNGKWVLLSTGYNGKEIRNEFTHSPSLSYTIRNKKFYPAMQFNVLDSTVMVPGNKTKKEKLFFSVDKNLENIQFFKKEISDSTLLVNKLFLNKFKIKKDKGLGGLKLESDRMIIYMMPAEKFSRQINSSQLD